MTKNPSPLHPSRFGLPEEVDKQARRELDRLAKLPPAAAECAGGRLAVPLPGLAEAGILDGLGELLGLIREFAFVTARDDTEVDITVSRASGRPRDGRPRAGAGCGTARGPRGRSPGCARGGAA